MYFSFYLKIKLCLQNSETFVFLCDMQIPFNGMCTQCPCKIWYLVSGVPLFTICRMNDLRSEFNSRNSVYNASLLQLLK